MVEDMEQVIDLINIVSAFGMQGSLVQIQSSRPVEFVGGPTEVGPFFSRNEPRLVSKLLIPMIYWGMNIL